eukprot:TRINITY_DN3060_c0_g1_i1.p1 TRINITY_DN3060_c0_g1~~TRINITY_DN3060_c0_g1_i1.p1  ORF type:complete len:295 (-),score=126.36 TRINITY_DN3060_c0_g1_i1:79-963(-)
MATSPFRNDCLAPKVALITGGGSGIGFEIAKQLGLHGCSIVLMGRRENFLKSAAEELGELGIKAGFCSGDVRNPTSADEVVSYTIETFGSLDILVNSAAGNFLCPSENLSTKGFKTVMDIDAVGVFNMSRAAFEPLKAAKGTIINISATLHYGATWYQIHASAAKAAIDSMTRTFALEWGEYGIRVNGIAPGPIGGTAGFTKLAPGADTSAIEQMAALKIPIKRIGQKIDIGYTTVFLCCDAGSFISGETLVVDGGEWLYREPVVPKEMVMELSKRVEKKSRNVGGSSKLKSKL